jgi:glycosyltransferase involved in cell wall biosynthesis
MEVLRVGGADPVKLHVLRNGVDLQRFRPEDKATARRHLGLPADGIWLLSVGHLIERKGHDIVIQALALLPQARLALVGAGPQEATLRSLAQHLGVADRVRFVGLVPNEDLRWWYSAADVLALCSDREGWANVLLESMACGTPVVASDIWGTPEVVAAPEAGELMPQRTAQGVCAAYHRLLARRPDRAATRRYAEGFSWQATTQGQLQLFRQILEGESR